MPAARDVNPGRWEEITVVFDNDHYSVVVGQMDGKWTMGQRWNGSEGTPGYPSQGGNPLWHVVPAFLERAVFHGLLDELATSDVPDAKMYAERIANVMLTWWKT